MTMQRPVAAQLRRMPAVAVKREPAAASGHGLPRRVSSRPANPLTQVARSCRTLHQILASTAEGALA